MDNKIMTCFLLFATQNLYSLKKIITIFLKIFHKVHKCIYNNIAICAFLYYFVKIVENSDANYENKFLAIEIIYYKKRKN